MNNSAPVSRRRNATFSLILGALISLLAFFLIARSVNFDQTIQVIASADLLLFAAGFLAQMAATGFTVRRWQVFLFPYATRFFLLTQIFFSAHLLNTLLPAKLGTVARVLLAAESEKLNVGFVTGSVAIEKVLDTLVMVALLAVLSPFVPLPEWLRETFIASGGLVLVTSAGLLGVARFREVLLNGLARLETRLLGNRSGRITALVRGAIESVVNLTRGRELLRVLFWTGCVWLAGGLVNQVLFAAVNIHVEWSAAWFVMVVLQIGTRVPALPANLGVFHFLVILALRVYQVDESAALAFAVLLHLVVFILPAFFGAVCALPMSARLIALVTKSPGT